MIQRWLACYCVNAEEKTMGERTLLIGTDEAGYGPNLGPLLITATAWSVDDWRGEDDLYERLADCVTAQPPRRTKEPPTVVTMCDSKLLYSAEL